MGGHKLQSIFGSAVNVALAGALFGASVLLLFLFCYCCQKNARKETLPHGNSSLNVIVTSPVVATSMHVQHVSELFAMSRTRTETGTDSGSASPPPPSYDVVIKKEAFAFEENPPSYEAVMSSLHSVQSHGYL